MQHATTAQQVPRSYQAVPENTRSAPKNKQEAPSAGAAPEEEEKEEEEKEEEEEEEEDTLPQERTKEKMRIIKAEVHKRRQRGREGGKER